MASPSRCVARAKRVVVVRRRCIALAAGCVLAAGQAQAVPVNWVAPGDGFWDVPANWNPFPPGPGDTVTINVPAVLATIDHRMNNDIILSLNCAENLIVSGGSLRVNGLAQFGPGTQLTLSGGTFGANQVQAPGTSVLMTGGTFDSSLVVTPQITFQASTTSRLNNMNVQGNLNLTGLQSTARIGGTLALTGLADLGTSGRMVFDPAVTQMNGGQILFGAGTGQLGIEGGGQLMLGPGVLVHGHSGTIGQFLTTPGNRTLINQGNIVADQAGGLITINATTFTNSGMIAAANGGKLRLLGNWDSSAGNITVDNSTLELGGIFTTAGLHQATFQRLGTSTVILSGALNNAAANLNIGNLIFRGGSITGGTVTGDLDVEGTTGNLLDGVILSGTSALDIDSILRIGGGGISGGTINIQNTSELQFQTDGPIICQALFQRLSGGRVTLGGVNTDITFDAGTVLEGFGTFGGGIGSITNQGTIRSNVAGQTLRLSAASIDNDLFIESPAHLDIQTPELRNDGTIRTSGTGSMTINTSFLDNHELIHALGGGISITGSTGLTISGGGAIDGSAGGIQVQSTTGGISFTGNQSVAGVASLSAIGAGGNVSIANGVTLSSSGNLTINTPSLSNNGTINATSGGAVNVTGATGLTVSGTGQLFGDRPINLMSTTGDILVTGNQTSSGSGTTNITVPAGGQLIFSAATSQTAVNSRSVYFTAPIVNLGNNTNIAAGGGSTVTVRNPTGGLTVNGPAAGPSATWSATGGSTFLFQANGGELHLGGMQTFNITGAGSDLVVQQLGPPGSSLVIEEGVSIFASTGADPIYQSWEIILGGDSDSFGAPQKWIALESFELGVASRLDTRSTTTAPGTLEVTAGTTFTGNGSINLEGKPAQPSVGTITAMQASFGGNVTLNGFANLTVSAGNVSIGSSGVISSAGNLTISTPMITNSGMLSSTGGLTSVTGATGLTVSGSGNLSGAGPINFTATTGDIFVTGSQSSSGSGTTNFSAAGQVIFAPMTTQTISGGRSVNITSPTINLGNDSNMTASGASTVMIRDLTGTGLTINGPAAGNASTWTTSGGSLFHFDATGGELRLTGNLTFNVTGAGSDLVVQQNGPAGSTIVVDSNVSITASTGADPVFANTSGDITLGGSITTIGAPLAILASGNITTTSPSTIDIRSTTSTGGTINIVAGANFTLDGSLSMTGKPTQFAVGTMSATGGNINVGGSVSLNSFASLSLNAGNVTISATGSMQGGNVSIFTPTLSNSGNITSTGGQINIVSTAGLSVSGTGLLRANGGNLMLQAGTGALSINQSFVTATYQDLLMRNNDLVGGSIFFGSSATLTATSASPAQLGRILIGLGPLPQPPILGTAPANASGQGTANGGRIFYGASSISTGPLRAFGGQAPTNGSGAAGGAGGLISVVTSNGGINVGGEVNTSGGGGGGGSLAANGGTGGGGGEITLRPNPDFGGDTSFFAMRSAGGGGGGGAGGATGGTGGSGGSFSVGGTGGPPGSGGGGAGGAGGSVQFTKLGANLVGLNLADNINVSGGGGGGGAQAIGGAGGNGGNITVLGAATLTINGPILAAGGGGGGGASGGNGGSGGGGSFGGGGSGNAGAAPGGAGGVGASVILDNPLGINQFDVDQFLNVAGGNGGGGGLLAGSNGGAGGAGGAISITNVAIGTFGDLLATGGTGGGGFFGGGAGGTGGAGGLITISASSNLSTGLLRAYGGGGGTSNGGAAGAGGNISLTTSAGNITVNGEINASGGAGGGAVSATGAKGGSVSLTASSGSITVMGDLDVSTGLSAVGAGDGGSITLSAAGQVSVGHLYTPVSIDLADPGGNRTIFIVSGGTSAGNLDASGSGSGDGGTIQITSNSGGSGIFCGTIDASSQSGDGGSVMLTSNSGGNIAFSSIDASSASGRGGNVVIFANNGSIGLGSILAGSGNPGSLNGGMISLTSQGAGSAISVGPITAGVSGARGGTVVLASAGGPISLGGDIFVAGNAASFSASASTTISLSNMTVDTGGDSQIIVPLLLHSGAITTTGGNIQILPASAAGLTLNGPGSINARGGLIATLTIGDFVSPLICNAPINASGVGTAQGGQIFLRGSSITTGMLSGTGGLAPTDGTGSAGGAGGRITLTSTMGNINVNGEINTSGGGGGGGFLANSGGSGGAGGQVFFALADDTINMLFASLRSAGAGGGGGAGSATGGAGGAGGLVSLGGTGGPAGTGGGGIGGAGGTYQIPNVASSGRVSQIAGDINVSGGGGGGGAQANGGAGGNGGNITLLAAPTLTLNGPLLAAGGGGGGAAGSGAGGTGGGGGSFGGGGGGASSGTGAGGTGGSGGLITFSGTNFNLNFGGDINVSGGGGGGGYSTAVGGGAGTAGAGGNITIATISSGVFGNLLAGGGNNGTGVAGGGAGGAGGAGGSISIASTGNIQAAQIHSGGGGGGFFGGGSSGNGGNITLSSSSGAISVAGSINANGGVGSASRPGAGGAGGNVTLSAGANINLPGPFLASGGAGGTGGNVAVTNNGGAGGAGGSIHIASQAFDNFVNHFNVVGGAGGGGIFGGGAGGAGGDGGSITVIDNNLPFDLGPLRAFGGGGGANNGGPGGKGGTITITSNTGPTMVVGDINTSGGGAGGSPASLGGNGGSVSLTINTGALTVVGDLNASSGISAAAAGGNGGRITLSAGGLVSVGHVFAQGYFDGAPGGQIVDLSGRGVSAGNLNASGLNNGNGGNINITNNPGVSGVMLGTIDASSQQGRGGNVVLTSNSNPINTAGITLGAVNPASPNGGRVEMVSTGAGSGVSIGGNVLVGTAAGRGGDIFISSAGPVSFGGDVLVAGNAASFSATSSSQISGGGLWTIDTGANARVVTPLLSRLGGTRIFGGTYDVLPTIGSGLIVNGGNYTASNGGTIRFNDPAQMPPTTTDFQGNYSLTAGSAGTPGTIRVGGSTITFANTGSVTVNDLSQFIVFNVAPGRVNLRCSTIVNGGSAIITTPEVVHDGVLNNLNGTLNVNTPLLTNNGMISSTATTNFSSTAGLTLAGNGILTVGGGITTITGQPLDSVVTSPFANISVTGGNLVINAGQVDHSGSIVGTGGQIQVNAPLNVTGSIDLTNSSITADLLRLQSAGMLHGQLTITGGTATGGSLILEPQTMMAAGLSSLNIPTNVTVTNAAFSASSSTVVVGGNVSNIGGTMAFTTTGSVGSANIGGMLNNSGAFTVGGGPGTSAVSVGSIITGNGSLTVNPGGMLDSKGIRQGSLFFQGLATVRPDGGPLGTSLTNAVVITIQDSPDGTGGQLDLNDNDLIVDYSLPEASPLSEIRGYITSGYAGGSWSGDGIVSSMADLVGTFGLGYGEASAVFTIFPALFSGQMVDSTSVLVAYTLYGDADLNGNVNLNDFNSLAANFGLGSGALWTQGDFDYNGNVNLNDFNRLAANFGMSVGPEGPTPQDWARLTAAIPEPATLTSLLALAPLWTRRRARRARRASACL